MRIDEQEEKAVLEVLRAKRLFRYYGPYEGPSQVQLLETEFAQKMGSTFAVGVSSGSASLMCGLAALGVGPGDEVIIPAYTWIATAETVMAVGAVPVLAEIDNSLMIDPLDIQKRITPHTKAIIPVHMRGRPCDMERIMDIAQKNNLKVLEDTAQADGASYRGRHLGTIGEIGAFSFQFNKILTCGEGGIVITDEREYFERIVMYHDVVGGSRNNIPPEKILPGLNFRMTELQGAIMRVQLKRLDGLLRDMRQRKAMLKGAMLEKARQKGVEFAPLNDPEGEAAISLVFFAPSRERTLVILDALRAEGVPASILYHPDKIDYHIYSHWAPVLNKTTWSEMGGPWRWHKGDIQYTKDMCPRTLGLLERAIHLDISPDLDNENIEELAEGLNKVLDALL
jgi:dTDP-4-amino-4,6-dideoxygalactose transaminase